MNITRQLAQIAVASTMLIVAVGPARAQTIDWVRQFGTAVRDVAHEVAVDSASNVYVAGNTSGMLPGEGGAGFSGAFLARYDVAGNLVWIRPADASAGLATDSAGFVYVVGGSGTALVAKYDAAGVRQWVRTFGVPGFGSATATGVATDLEGNVYVVGTASQAAAPPPSSQNNSFLAKYESSGTQLWFRATGGPPTLQPPTFIDVATADTGHVYIAGWNNPQSAITTLTLSVRQYDLAGNVGWIGGYGQSTEFNQAAVAVTVDTLGNIYVAGWAAPRFSADVNALVVRFDTAGNRLWVQTLPADVFGGDRPTDVAADAQGTVYIVGAATILAFDSAGTQLWAHQIGDPSSDLIESAAVDASDALYLAGTTTGAILGKTPLGQEDAFLVKLVPPSTRVGYYEIVSRNSDKCLDVYGASTEAAASVIQWTCHGGENQQWRLEPADDGAFRVVARHSGQVLDVYAALVDDRTPIIQYPSHGGDNQLWTIEPTSDGYVRIVARHTGKLLDVEGASIYDGAQVIQYTGHGGANQQWLLRAVVSTAALVTTASDRDQ